MNRLAFYSLSAALTAMIGLVQGCGAPGVIDGARARAHVEAMVAIGPRPAGSAALAQCRDYIVGELRKLGIEPTVDKFTKEEQAPGIEFHNIEFEIPGTNTSDPRVLVLGGHYDTKRVDVPDNPNQGMNFVGANDGGSSAGLLIELARHFKNHPLPCRLLLVWFDGEESIPWQWDMDRALFGSRRSVAQLRKRFPKSVTQGAPVMVLLDMVGSKELSITKDTASNPELLAIIGATARELGHSDKFFHEETEVTDDHVPFINFGIKAIDIIQFDAKVQGSWWHTAADNMSLISAESLAIVGEVVAKALPKIAARYYK